jgi:hypothetical protein
MNLKQALLVNSALPDSMKLKPKSILKKDVINTSPDEAFRGITVRQADHYTRSVQTSLSHSKGVISKSAAAERAK